MLVTLHAPDQLRTRADHLLQGALVCRRDGDWFAERAAQIEDLLATLRVDQHDRLPEGIRSEQALQAPVELSPATGFEVDRGGDHVERSEMALQLRVDQRHHDLALREGRVSHPLAFEPQQIEDAECGEHDGRQHGCDAQGDQRAPEEGHGSRRSSHICR
jgi:hypothetical protein